MRVKEAGAKERPSPLLLSVVVGQVEWRQCAQPGHRRKVWRSLKADSRDHEDGKVYLPPMPVAELSS